MKKTLKPLLIDEIVRARSENIDHIVYKDELVIKKIAELDTVLERIRKANKSLYTELDQSINAKAVEEIDAAYRAGLVEGMRLAREFQQLENDYAQLVASFGKG